MKKKLYMIPESEVIDLTLTNSLLAGSLEKTDKEAEAIDPKDADAEEFYDFEEEGTGLNW